MKRIPVILFLAGLFMLPACKSVKPTADASAGYTAPEVEVVFNGTYRSSAARTFDLLHTALDVRFDYRKRHLIGKATLTLKPYHYPTNQLTLDAKGMNLYKVQRLINGQYTDLAYTYDSAQINITLDKTYTRYDSLQVYIEYTAKPDELPKGGSAAISGDKGLYFIDPDSTDAEKPTQIWTQGETEASSCWFPTIDKPNERCTADVRISYDPKYTSISNGLKKSTTKNADGSVTDHWVMDKPHAPYLFMMTIGEFSETRDKWRDLDLRYFVEKDYAPYAKRIFGNTPEMIEFFSNKLGYDFPWQKYDQVIVRDYVSGAMENTGAVIFGEFVQIDNREALDAQYEDIVSHELSHHWFGDLVTCESWSNLPLNESFATYCEFLWNEYKYGKDHADAEQYDSQQGYLAESKQKNVDLVRFYYKDKEDMFDGHSYNKGGWVLHMLRNEIGDSAYFEGLRNYLHMHQYQSVEIHDLRLALEKACGRDLNPFFNQWFMNSGHPVVDIKTTVREDSILITLTQKQNCDKGYIYRLPVSIDIYYDAETERHQVDFIKKEMIFSFPAKGKPRLIDMDGDRILLMERNESKSVEQYAWQLEHGRCYVAKAEAIRKLKDKNTKPQAREALLKQITNPFWRIRAQALDALRLNKDSMTAAQLNELRLLAENDPKSAVRAAAVNQMGKLKIKEQKPILEKALGDSSYAVISAALNALYKWNAADGLTQAQKLTDVKNARVLNTIGEMYAKEGKAEYIPFFEKSIGRLKSWNKFGLIGNYGQLISKIGTAETVKQSIVYLTALVKDNTQQYLPLIVGRALATIREGVENTKKPILEQIKSTKDKKEKTTLAEKLIPVDKLIQEVKEAEEIVDKLAEKEEEE